VSLTLLLQLLVNGLVMGGLLGLVALGLALIFGVMRIVNFAHGAFMMLGMYVTYLLFDRLGVTPYVGFLAAAESRFCARARSARPMRALLTSSIVPAAMARQTSSTVRLRQPTTTPASARLPLGPSE
jgi:branched-subunit amino acid ABC-type transport system permease component